MDDDDDAEVRRASASSRGRARPRRGSLRERLWLAGGLARAMIIVKDYGDVGALCLMVPMVVKIQGAGRGERFASRTSSEEFFFCCGLAADRSWRDIR